MAAGEYVSVHSQADTEEAALDQERAELKADVNSERRELAAIYRRRGLDAKLARQVIRRDAVVEGRGAGDVERDAHDG